MEKLSPMMQQYMEIKKLHQDKILFFRLGDFYEMFFDDAKLVSKELELVLTGRDCGSKERAPMCGIPYHSCDGYIEKLVKKGYKIAICEQVEDPKTAKGIVRREVVKIITPGTLTENNMLKEDEHNYIISIVQKDKHFGIAIADVSTGEVILDDLGVQDIEGLKGVFYLYNPKEIVFNEDFLSQKEMGLFIKASIPCTADILVGEIYEDKDLPEMAMARFGAEALEESGIYENVAMAMALWGILHYLYFTQKRSVERLVSIKRQHRDRFLNLDPASRRNLELTQTLRGGERKGSLLWVMDHTRTALGKRLMRLYVEQPICNAVQIDNRLNAVSEMVDDTVMRLDILEGLTRIYDIERLMTKVVCRSAQPRELLSLKMALLQLPTLKSLLEKSKSTLLQEIYTDIHLSEKTVRLIETAIDENPPSNMKDGHYIQIGYHQELDELRNILSNTKGILAKIEAEERERTGIKTLKIGYNRVFGYYLEATKLYSEMVPPHYIRKQTLSNCERYITEDLKKLEDKILTANERISAIEGALYSEVLDAITQDLEEISCSAAAVARLDVFSALAQLAVEHNYCRPEVSLSGRLEIKDGRHPVVEQLMGNDRYFVANDTLLDGKKNQVAIITGPNMAGKSTYIRQVAIITLMAHMGSFVPATSATIPITDGVYTRIGASDDLAAGLSTFMVEMSEMANILKNATAKSLLILDEVGRGTSTFDGMSIARAVIEYICSKIKAKTLFATHYHELTELEDALEGVQNYNTAVKKQGDDIIFLRKIIPGGIDQSYGIEVSRLAGIPDWVVKRAKSILKELEEKGHAIPKPRKKATPEHQQVSLVHEGSAILDELKNLSLDTLTPIEAMTKLYQLKGMLKG